MPEVLPQEELTPFGRWLSQPKGAKTHSRTQRQFEEVLAATSQTPLHQPRRCALALLGLYKGAVSTRAEQQAQLNNDHFFMCTELLATYIGLREGMALPSRLGSIADTPNPSVGPLNTLRACTTGGVNASELRLHAVRRTVADDPFVRDLSRLVDARRSELDAYIGGASSQPPSKALRNLLAQLLLILSVRSEPLLDLFLREGVEIDVGSPECLPKLYEEVLAKTGGVFPGQCPRKGRRTRTTEQNVWSLGYIVDTILAPYWKDPSFYDQLFRDPGRLASQKLFKGDLLFSTTYEYLVRLFTPEQATAALRGGPVRSGPNGAAFLALCNVGSQRSETHSYTWTNVLRRVEALLDTSGVYTEFDMQSSACKCIECFQTILTGSALGKGRSTEPVKGARRVRSRRGSGQPPKRRTRK